MYLLDFRFEFLADTDEPKRVLTMNGEDIDEIVGFLFDQSLLGYSAAVIDWGKCIADRCVPRISISIALKKMPDMTTNIDADFLNKILDFVGGGKR